MENIPQLPRKLSAKEEIKWKVSEQNAFTGVPAAWHIALQNPATMISRVVQMGIGLILVNGSIGHSPTLEDRKNAYESTRFDLDLHYRRSDIRASVALEKERNVR